MRLIDADALLNELDKFADPMPNKSGYDFLCGIATVTTEIEEQSTVDAVEVIRCKDCKKYRTDACAMSYMDRDEHMTHCWARTTDFCSYGERKDNEIQNSD